MPLILPIMLHIASCLSPMAYCQSPSSLLLCLALFISLSLSLSHYIFLFIGGREIAPPSMVKVKGGSLRRWSTVHRKATAKPDATGRRPRNAATNQPQKTTRAHSSQACAHVVWCRRSVGRGVALRLQPKVLQSSSREDKATATRRSTARREHTT